MFTFSSKHEKHSVNSAEKVGLDLTAGVPSLVYS